MAMPTTPENLDTQADKNRGHAHPLPPVHGVLIHDDADEKRDHLAGYRHRDRHQAPKLVDAKRGREGGKEGGRLRMSNQSGHSQVFDKNEGCRAGGRKGMSIVLTCYR